MVTAVTGVLIFPLSGQECPCYFPSKGDWGLVRPPLAKSHMSKVALVVDDSMLIRYSLCRHLEGRGFKVEVAVNGAEAMEVLSRVQPDLIVTDMRMPKMSGSELITALKSNEKTSRIPVLVVTSKANGTCEADERADFVIYKDIDVETQMDAALEVVMDKRSPGHSAGH